MKTIIEEHKGLLIEADFDDIKEEVNDNGPDESDSGGSKNSEQSKLDKGTEEDSDEEMVRTSH